MRRAAYDQAAIQFKGDAMISAQRDYYEVLGVAKDAEQKAIKDAFRNLAMKYHPDRNKEPGAEERFKEIAEAYAILSDPKKRAEYDARGFAGVEGFSQEDLFSGINFDDIFGGLNFDFGGDGPFEGFFHRRRTGPARGANIEVELSIPLERVASGGEEKVRLSRPSTCPACHGTGVEGGAHRKGLRDMQGHRTHHPQQPQGKRTYPDPADHHLPRLPWARQHHRPSLLKMPRQRRSGTAGRPNREDPDRCRGGHGAAHSRQGDAKPRSGRCDR